MNKLTSAHSCSSGLHHVSITECCVSLLEVLSHRCDSLVATSLVVRCLIATSLVARSLIARSLIPQLWKSHPTAVTDLSFGGAADGESDDVVKKFNPAHPEGNYTLSMTVPAQRTIAALLCNLDLEHKEDIIKNIKLDGKPIVSSVKKLKWPAK